MKRLALLSPFLLFLAIVQPLSSCDPSNVIDPPPAADPDITAGLIAHYAFAGNARDTSGNGHDGVAVGTAPAADIHGRPGRAYAFDGTSARILLPDSLLQKNRALTVTLWFRTGAGGVMLGYQSAPYPDFPPSQYVPAMYVGIDGKAYAEFWNGDDTPLVSAFSVSDSQWHFMALLGDDTTQTLIVDDVVVGSMPGTIDHLGMVFNQIGMGNTGVNNSLGWAGGNDHWYGFSGTIDNVRIYGRALRVSECDTLFRFKK